MAERGTGIRVVTRDERRWKTRYNTDAQTGAWRLQSLCYRC